MSLHKEYFRAAPKLLSLYQTAMNYFDVMKGDVFLLEQNQLINNTLSNHRNPCITFARTNNNKDGLNLFTDSGRFQTLLGQNSSFIDLFYNSLKAFT